jgi:uncharacterized membrane protein YfcA
MDIWMLVVLGSVLAGFVQGLSGFGFGMVALAVWSWVIEPAIAVPLVVFGSLVGQLLASGSLRQSFAWRRFIPFLCGGILGVPIGLWLFSVFDPLLFKFGVGMVLSIYCTAMLFITHLPKISHGGRLADGFVGMLGGAMSGFGGLPGPAPTLWCNLRGWPKDEQRTVFQAFNLFMHGITLAAFAAHGMLTREIFSLFTMVAPAMLIPTLLGIRLYRHFSDSSFRRFVLGLLALSGMMLLASTAPAVWRLL